jgi:hypothetical protein
VPQHTLTVQGRPSGKLVVCPRAAGLPEGCLPLSLCDISPKNLDTGILGIGYLKVSSTSETASDTRIGRSVRWLRCLSEMGACRCHCVVWLVCGRRCVWGGGVTREATLSSQQEQQCTHQKCTTRHVPLFLCCQSCGLSDKLTERHLLLLLRGGGGTINTPRGLSRSIDLGQYTHQ